MLSRRFFLLSSVAVSSGCVLGRSPKGDDKATAAARPPQVGQAWRYTKRDTLTGTLIDAETHRVNAIGDTIEVEIRSEARPDENDRAFWDPFSLMKHPRRAVPARQLPSEIQKPWGMVVIDPHWSETLAFQKAIPLWPTVLRAGWSTQVRTDYLTPELKSPLTWQLTMHAHAWESISTPAGTFRALRYTNFIDFTSDDIFRRSSQRRETIWFVPEVGRWAARESSGSYYHEDSVDDQQLREASFRWELQEWS